MKAKYVGMLLRVWALLALSYLVALPAGPRLQAQADKGKPAGKKTPSTPKSIPVSGTAGANVELFDHLMLGYLRKIGCTTAVLAISRDGVPIYSRGYGWLDEARTVPAPENTLMGIASCDKPMTRAAILQLARAGKVKMDAPVFKHLGIKPAGKVIDKRIWSVTVQNCMDMKGGWGNEVQDKAYDAAHKAGAVDPILPTTLLSHIMVHKLKDDPGTTFEYTNTCYGALRPVIKKATGKSFARYLHEDLLRPYGVTEMREIQTSGERIKGWPPQVWNTDSKPNENAVAVSAPAMGKFMKHFYFDGLERKGGGFVFIGNGSLDNSTAQMFWRGDGIDIAWVFNGRRDVSHDQVIQDLEKVLPTALVLGDYDWHNGAKVEFRQRGKLTATPKDGNATKKDGKATEGRWLATPGGGYVLLWKDGRVDAVRFGAGFDKLEGAAVEPSGKSVALTGTKRASSGPAPDPKIVEPGSPPAKEVAKQPIVGEYTWYNNFMVTINKDGTVGKDEGRWIANPFGGYVIMWNNGSVNVVHSKSNPPRLEGAEVLADGKSVEIKCVRR